MRNMLILTLLVGGALGGCATPTPPPIAPEQIRKPAGWLMKPPAELPDIPLDEGNQKLRVQYYVMSRRMYAELVDQVRGLQLWAATVTRPEKP